MPLKLLVALLILAAPRLRGTPADESAVTATVDAAHPGPAIGPDFAGLSYEVSLLLPGPGGARYFRADNAPLLRLFHTLGIKNLRIGGNTSDRNVRTLPEQGDLDSLFGFARAADLKVIYCLRLHGGDPQIDAETAKYIMGHYAAEMDSFSIGQEPSAYPKPYSSADFLKDWKRFADIIHAAAPEARFCGPSVHNNADWARRFLTNFARGNNVVLVTEHLYPGGAGGKVPSPAEGRDRMLSTNFTRVYEKLRRGFFPLAAARGLPCRLEEVNNFFNGGAEGVSDTLASALWGLDFMHWWAAHGAAGLNFHTGDKVAAGPVLRPSIYTAFFTTTNGFLIRPLAYGIKAFDLGGHGRIVPVALHDSDDINLTAYAVLAADGSLCVTFINKEHDPHAKTAAVSLSAVPGLTHAQVISLSAPGEDAVAATNNITLGGAEIQSDGSWDGQWTGLPADAKGVFVLKIPPASASIVRLMK